MFGFRDDMGSGFNDCERESFEDVISEKDRLISLQERDMESLKREIVYLKQKFNSSKKKK